MLYRELRDRFIKFNREHPNATPLKGFIVFSAENWPKTYSEKSRTYEVHSDNKAFRPNANSCSLFGSSLDGTDQGVRLDWYMADFGIPGGWAVERCIIEEPIARVDFTPNDIEAVYDEIDRRIDAEIRDGDFTDEKGEMMDFNYPNNDVMAAIIGGMMGAARAAAEDAAQNQKPGASGKTGPGIQNPAKIRDELLKKAAQGVAANAKVLYDAFIAVGFPADAAISLTGSVLGAANHKF